MRQRVMRSVGVLLLCGLTSCSSAVEDSDVYLELAARVEEARAELDVLQLKATEEAEKLATAQDQVSQLEGDLASMVDDEATLKEQRSSLELSIGKSEGELTLMKASLEEVEAAVVTFKESSGRFKAAVKSSVAKHRRYLCADDWISELRSLGLGGLSPVDIASDPGEKSKFSINDMITYGGGAAIDADCGRWGKDEILGAESTVLNRVCERINNPLLKKNPSAFQGKCLRGSAWVTQFDSNTGLRTFHASVGSRYGERVEMELITLSGDPLYEGVGFDFWAIGDGILSYSTTLGGTNTIPSLDLIWYLYY